STTRSSARPLVGRRVSTSKERPDGVVNDTAASAAASVTARPSSKTSRTAVLGGGYREPYGSIGLSGPRGSRLDGPGHSRAHSPGAWRATAPPGPPAAVQTRDFHRPARPRPRGAVSVRARQPHP